MKVLFCIYFTPKNIIKKITSKVGYFSKIAEIFSTALTANNVSNHLLQNQNMPVWCRFLFEYMVQQFFSTPADQCHLLGNSVHRVIYNLLLDLSAKIEKVFMQVYSTWYI